MTAGLAALESVKSVDDVLPAAGEDGAVVDEVLVVDAAAVESESGLDAGVAGFVVAEDGVALLLDTSDGVELLKGCANVFSWPGSVLVEGKASEVFPGLSPVGSVARGVLEMGRFIQVRI